MKAKVDEDTCIGCALCVQTCPQVFVMQLDKAIVIIDSVSKETEASCRQALEECPVNAIIME